MRRVEAAVYTVLVALAVTALLLFAVLPANSLVSDLVYRGF